MGLNHELEHDYRTKEEKQAEKEAKKAEREARKEEKRKAKEAKAQTGAKISGKALSLILVGAIAATSIGSYFGYKALKKHIDETNTFKRTTAIVKTYKVDDVCSFDEPIYSTQIYDTKICDGKVLVDVLNEQGIKYCEILDEYYTNNGRDIALVPVTITFEEFIEPTKINDEVKGSEVSYYTLPEGYVLKNNKGYRVIHEERTITTEVRKDNDYSKIELKGADRVGTITSVGEPTIVHTKKFEEIINSDFVCDVKDDYAANKTEGLSNAEYRLMPKR